MFEIDNAKHLSEFHLDSYQKVRDDLSASLERVNIRLMSDIYVEELYRFGNTEFFLEVFYLVPSAWQASRGKSISTNDANIQFGIFNWETNEPIPLEEALRKLPKECRKLVCLNIDHFSEMGDVFCRG